MSFYRRDYVNDNNRKVVHVRSCNASEFWQSGLVKDHFLLTGGDASVREGYLCSAIQNYVENQRRPVLILHNSATLDKKLPQYLQRSIAPVTYGVFDRAHRNYQPFAGMNRNDILTCIVKQAETAGYGDVMALRAYAEGFLQILEQYESLSLRSMLKLCDETDARIEKLADEVHVPTEVKNKILRNEHAGTVFRTLVGNLSASMNPICSLSEHSSRSISGWFTMQKQTKVLSICLGASNIEPMLRYLVSEIERFQNREFLLVLHEINIKERTGLYHLLSNVMARNSFGLCGSEISSLFENDEQYKNIRSKVRKYVIMQNSDAVAAEKIADVAGMYDRKRWEVVKAPHMPWEIIVPKTKQLVTDRVAKIDTSEVAEIPLYGAILYGHRSDEIWYVQRLYD